MGRYPFEAPDTTTVTILTPSGDTTGVTDALNILAAGNSLPTPGGDVQLAGGTWYIDCDQVAWNRSGIYVRGAGKWATYVYAVGTGDVFRFYDSSSMGTDPPYERAVNGGGLTGMTIDGVNAGAGSAGFHIGDILQFEFDVAVRNFTGAGSIGAHLDNQYYWTEQASGIIYAENCTQHVAFDVSSGAQLTTVTGSFDRMDLAVWVNQVTPTYDGVVFQNGAYLDSGALAIRGNFLSSASALTSAVLRVTGETPGGATYPSYAQISSSRLDIGVECDGTAAHGPYTIAFGSSNNSIIENYGLLEFLAETTAFTECANPSYMTYYGGPISGDNALANQEFITTLGTTNLTVYETAVLEGGTNTFTGAASSSPSFSTGVAKQLDTTQDVILYIAVETSAALAVAIGPTSSPANTIAPSKSYALSMLTIRVPAGWYVEITGTIADLTITQVTC